MRHISLAVGVLMLVIGATALSAQERDPVAVGAPLPVLALSGDSGGDLDGNAWSSDTVHGPAVIILGTPKELRLAIQEMQKQSGKSANDPGARPSVVLIVDLHGQKDLRPIVRGRLKDRAKAGLTVLIDRQGTARMTWFGSGSESSAAKDHIVVIRLNAEGTVENLTFGPSS